MDDATIEIMLRIRQIGTEAIRDVVSALGDLRTRALEVAAVLGSTGAFQQVTSALSGLVTTANDAGVAATKATGSASGFTGILGMSAATTVLVGVITAAVLLFSPFIVLLAGAVVIMTAFAVGVTAVTTALGLAFVPLALLTGGVIMLADRMFTTGQTLVDPLARFELMLRNVANNLGNLVMPWALQFTNWMADAVVKLAPLTYQLAYWFGERFPQIIQIANTVLWILVNAFQSLGSTVGFFIDTMLRQSPQFLGFFQLLAAQGVIAVQSLLFNLLNLSDWFMQRLPAMAPIVASIMGAIGSFIQGVGFVAGQVVDWFIKNWPTIASVANDAWNNIKKGWDFLAPVLQKELPFVLEVVRGAFLYASQHADQLRAVMFAVGVVAGGITIVILALTAGVIGALKPFLDLVGAIQAVATWLHNAWNEAGKFLSILSMAFKVAQNWPGGPPSGGVNPPGSGSVGQWGGMGWNFQPSFSGAGGAGRNINATFNLTSPDSTASANAVYRALTSLLQ